jgi:hypothetical protein
MFCPWPDIEKEDSNGRKITMIPSITLWRDDFLMIAVTAIAAVGCLETIIARTNEHWNPEDPVTFALTAARP